MIKITHKLTTTNSWLAESCRPLLSREERSQATSWKERGRVGGVTPNIVFCGVIDCVEVGHERQVAAGQWRRIERYAKTHK